ncbi:hypothetical protein [Blastochloris sulfoviridis]|uniref:Uncharacterized protein n=1 Tax=Blastochloris sulfoviridis TaxID=50712 RepID=A0A5M6I1W9_9HYPH|nr:hypothetical protein [Blastochloris sulfoviridis]KAA5601849.1 hypothetical protein F1193_07930 [Blastochloris sulfoviridis]
MGVIDVLDDQLKSLLLRGWDEEALQRFLRNIRRSHAASTDQGAIRQAVDQIDVQATGILTHVSMMIAALGVTAASDITSEFQETVLYVTIVCYLFVAIVCLRCIRPPSVEHGDYEEDDYINELLLELVYERELNRRANSAAIALTLFVFLYLPFSVLT